MWRGSSSTGSPSRWGCQRAKAAHWTGVGIDLDLQYTTVQPGEGEFTLIHGMAGPGYFHLQLAGKDSDTFADIYFGTGDNVWRK